MDSLLDDAGVEGLLQSVSSRPAPGEMVVPESLTPASKATAGYRLNHSMLRITDPARSMEFYVGFMGMSLIFKLNAGPFTVYYLGYSAPEKDEQRPIDIMASMNHQTGLLELLHTPGHEGPRSSAVSGATETETAYNNEQGRMGFGHLGFCVPDVEATLQRAEKSGITVLKWTPDVSVRTMALPDHVREGAFHPRFTATYCQVGFIKDPDGYWVELLPLQFRH